MKAAFNLVPHKDMIVKMSKINQPSDGNEKWNIVSLNDGNYTYGGTEWRLYFKKKSAPKLYRVLP